MKRAAAALLLLFHASAASAQLPAEPEKLLEAMDKILRGDSHEMSVTMDVKTPAWERSYEIKVWMKGLDNAFARVLKPAKSEGQGFLRVKTRLWNYLPSAERTVLIPPSMMLDRFLGSDFSNDDFVKLTYMPRDYDAKIIGEETIEGHSSYRLELTPRENAPVTYGKLEIWLRKEDAAPVRWDFFSEQKEPIRRLHYSEYKTFGTHLIPTLWKMENLKDPGRMTVIKIADANFDLPLDDGIFTRERLEKYP